MIQFACDIWSFSIGTPINQTDRHWNIAEDVATQPYPMWKKKNSNVFLWSSLQTTYPNNSRNYAKKKLKISKW
jgi:hypothetical protein